MVNIKRRARIPYVVLAVLSVPLSIVANMQFVGEARAATATKNASSCTTGNKSVTVWANPTSAGVSDNAYATTTAYSNIVTDELLCSNFGFAIPTGSVVGGISLSIERKAGSNSGAVDSLVTLRQGSTRGTNLASSTAWGKSDAVVTYGSTTELWGLAWTPTNINSSLYFGPVFAAKGNISRTNTLSVDAMSITVTYTQYSPSFNQSGYRWFVNTDSVSGGNIGVGAPLRGVAQNTPTSVLNGTAIIRLRLLLQVAGALASNQGGFAFKLQYAPRGPDNLCDSSWSGETYADVTTSSAIAYADNPNAIDGRLLTASVDDPVQPGYTTILQEYNEVNDTTVRNSIQNGQIGLWDFALYNRSATPSTTYCFRMVNADNTLLSAYSRVAQIDVPADGGASSYFVDWSGSGIVNPYFSMSTLSYMSVCQTSTVKFFELAGVKLRVQQINNTRSGWSVAIAATHGATSTWEDGWSGYFYDFNDPSGSPPGCSPGADGDMYAGQLTLDLSQMGVAPVTQCTTDGLTVNKSIVPYSSGVVDSITLVSMASPYPTDCAWDVYNIGASQTVPAHQEAGNYEMSLTITTTAN